MNSILCSRCQSVTIQWDMWGNYILEKCGNVLMEPMGKEQSRV